MQGRRASTTTEKRTSGTLRVHRGSAMHVTPNLRPPIRLHVAGGPARLLLLFAGVAGRGSPRPGARPRVRPSVCDQARQGLRQNQRGGQRRQQRQRGRDQARQQELADAPCTEKSVVCYTRPTHSAQSRQGSAQSTT